MGNIDYVDLRIDLLLCDFTNEEIDTIIENIRDNHDNY